MKKFLFILSFLAVGALTTMNAQTTEKKACSKSASKACCAKKATASADGKTTSVAGATMEASTEGAQTKACSKTAAEHKACTAKGKSVAGVVMTASEAAAADETIEARTCAKSGNVSYYQKSQCPVSGKVTMDEVKYNMESGKFVNASPSEMEGAKKATTCNKQVKSAKVVKTSVKE
jgi:hypothetical protein